MTGGDGFATFAGEAEPRLRRALVAAYGPTDGADAVAGAMAYAWEHWEEVRIMTNPHGYLYRVDQTSVRRRLDPTVRLPRAPENEERDFEPGLPAALEALTVPQRTAVLLVHGYGYTHEEVAGMLDVSVSTVRNHLARGLAKLRTALEVDIDA